MEPFKETEGLINAEQSIKESVKTLVKSSARKFLFLTFIFTLPLTIFQLLFEDSFVVLVIAVTSLFDKASPEYQYADSLPSHEQFVRPYYIRNFVYLVFCFSFYVLSTSAMIFTVASRYVSRPVSYISVLQAIPSISKRLLILSIYTLPLLIVAYLANFACLSLVHAIPKLNVIAIIFAIIYGFFITVVDVYIMALWNLANVISVLEPNVHGLSAMKRSRQLLPGRTSIAMILVDVYLLAALVILLMATLVMTMKIYVIVRILLIAFCVIIMAGVNFVGLIGQSVLYYIIKPLIERY